MPPPGPKAALRPCRTGMPALEAWRPRQTHPQPPLLHRSDVASIKAITTAANGGLVAIGGWYVYVTLPYVYAAVIVELGIPTCKSEFKPMLSYGGPDECKGANYDNSKKTCKSDKTQVDTMGNQGRPDMYMWYH